MRSHAPILDALFWISLIGGNLTVLAGLFRLLGKKSYRAFLILGVILAMSSSLFLHLGNRQ